MRVNKERVNQVLAAIEDVAARGTNYTFDKFCREHNLYSEYDRERTDGSVFICCPFHRESRPSLSIDEPRRRYKCFGCNSGYRYIDFLVEYDKKVNGIDMSVAQKANELLKRDPELRARVGFDTIYQQDIKTIGSFNKLSTNKFSIRPTMPKTYLELSSILLKEKVSTPICIFAVSLAQKGIPPEVIYQQVKQQREVSVKKKYTLAELNEEK